MKSSIWSYGVQYQSFGIKLKVLMTTARSSGSLMASKTVVALWYEALYSSSFPQAKAAHAWIAYTKVNSQSGVSEISVKYFFMLSAYLQALGPMFILEWISANNIETPITTNCRVTRHLISTTSRQHGSPAETKPSLTICSHHPNTRQAKPIGKAPNFIQKF